MIDIASWISPFIHQLNIPVSLEDRGLISYLYSTYSLQDLGIFLSQYFIPILETVDFLLPKSGLLQDFYNLIDDSSFKSNGYFLSLD